ncbi:MAG: tetratricopeptide repeat protein [Sulfuriflexus sp.]|nr:tetratricopeptide repeat protein [Sulfuriflexus sp.]
MRELTFVTMRAASAAQTFRHCSRRLLAPCSFLLLFTSISLLLVTSNSVAEPAVISPSGNQVLSADPLTNIVQLVNQGATELALQQLNAQQPNPLDEPEDWLRWERQRIALYQQAEQWQILIQRINSQASFIDLAYSEWFVAQQAEAMLELGQGTQARRIFRKLIWQRDTAHDDKALSLWRTHIIRSYLLDDKTNDAHAAMLRNAQDYPSDISESGVLLRARVLLLARRADDAAELLSHNKKLANAKTLYLLAALRSSRLSSSKVIKEINTTLKKKKLAKLDRLRLLAIKIEASEVDGKTGQAVAAIEKYLSLTRENQIDDGLFQINGEKLWQAYLKHGQTIGNKQQLLLGDDASWFAEAGKHKKNSLRQRTLYGLLALESRASTTRDQANELLINSLRKKKNGIEIIRHLYLGAKELPALARYSLLDQALKESDISLASQLMQGLQQAPKGIKPLSWELRRARVFVMAGKPDDASSVLRNIVNENPLTDNQALDRFMQVVFDLQTVEAHEPAYQLFAILLKKIELPKVQRELYYWMAESRKAQARYADAAALYLKSSESKSAPQPDLWAQSALYQAAEALGNAGLVDDARRLYRKLLRITKDEARRGQLQRRIQQLWLKRSKAPA